MSYCDLKKYGRVLTGNAQVYQSERIFEKDVRICPIPKNVDSLGRDADPNSLRTLSAGCNSALDRECVENEQRLNRFSYATLSPDGIIYGGKPDSLQYMNVLIAKEHAAAAGYIIPDRKGYYNTILRNMQWEYLSDKVQYYKTSSGMN